MRLLLDEHLDRRFAEQLRTRGYDVLAVAESGDLIEADDPTVLERCIADGRVLATYNVRDFRPLVEARLAAGETLPGVLLLSPRTYPQGTRSFGAIIERLLAVLDAHGGSALPFGMEWL